LSVELVLSAGVSLRGVARVLELISGQLQLRWWIPHWTTVRGWILRLGLAQLERVEWITEPQAWLVDHSIQIGTRKCLGILRIRLRDLPPPGRCLKHTDLQLIGLVIAESSTKEQVAEHLEATAARAGVPAVIVDDHGADLSGGVRIFQQHHPETVEIYDIKHKAACLLKKRLQNDARWKDFQHQLGQAKFATQQTPLAHVAPPSQRSKARFMNLGKLIRWGNKLLGWIESENSPGARIQLDRIRDKFAWLRDFREPLRQWGAWQTVIDQAVDCVGSQGIHAGLTALLEDQLTHDPLAEPLRTELIEFVTTQAAQLSPGERVPGSTEVLESCFGKLKHLERNQATSGFTALLLTLGAMTAPRTDEDILAALRSTSHRSLSQWINDSLGDTVQSLRRYFYLYTPDCEQKPDEPKLALT
jgi:hypothetical protein